MPAILATGKDLKRKSIYINKYGEVKEGSIYEALGGNVVGGIGETNRVPETPRVVEEKKEE